MPIASVNIGKYRVVLAAYNPRDALSILACRYALHLAEVAAQAVDEDDFAEWIRDFIPDGDDLLKAIAGGWRLDQEAGFPVLPGEERLTLPIIAELKREKAAQNGILRDD